MYISVFYNTFLTKDLYPKKVFYENIRKFEY